VVEVNGNQGIAEVQQALVDAIRKHID
jgi:hypothetical protein